MALPSRLLTIWCARCGSTMTAGNVSSTSTRNAKPLVAASGSKLCAASVTRRTKSTGTARISSLPASRRAMSRRVLRSSTSRSLDERRGFSTRCASSDIACWPSRRKPAASATRGVRTSWLMSATKSARACAAWLARSRSRRSRREDHTEVSHKTITPASSGPPIRATSCQSGPT